MTTKNLAYPLDTDGQEIISTLESTLENDGVTFLNSTTNIDLLLMNYVVAADEGTSNTTSVVVDTNGLVPNGQSQWITAAGQNDTSYLLSKIEQLEKRIADLERWNSPNKIINNIAPPKSLHMSQETTNELMLANKSPTFAGTFTGVYSQEELRRKEQTYKQVAFSDYDRAMKFVK